MTYGRGDGGGGLGDSDGRSISTTLDKVPLVNRIRLQLVGGTAAAFSTKGIPDSKSVVAFTVRSGQTRRKGMDDLRLVVPPWSRVLRPWGNSASRGHSAGFDNGGASPSKYNCQSLAY